jgi:hypothetical protein
VQHRPRRSRLERRAVGDKREVLFAGSNELEEAVVRAVAGAPAAFSPLEAVAAGIEAAGALLRDDRSISRRRQAIIDATPTLRERELIKLASLAEALAAALRERGLDEPAAELTAELGIALFRVAFGRWIAPAGGEGDFSALVREALAELRALTAPETTVPGR